MADIYEKDLDSKTTLETSDYVRIVGDDNVSYKNRVADVAETVITDYDSQTLAGSQRTVKEAIDFLQNKTNNIYSPHIAHTVSEMTNQDLIYIYVGSESGYTNGNWYYYDGGTWVSGGVYNAVAVNTDTTLSISGRAADAKATGDAIDGLDDDITDLKEDIETFTGNESVGFAKDLSVTNSAPTTQASERGWESVIVSCEEGDVFHVLGWGGNSTRLWIFSDSNGTVLTQSVAALHVTELVKIIAPPDAAYLACNSQYTSTSGVLIKGDFLYDVINEMENDIANYMFPIISECTLNNGTLQNVYNTNCVYTNTYCPVYEGGYAQIETSRAVSTEGGYYKYGWVTYDSGLNIVEDVTVSNGNLTGKVPTPSGVAYIRYSIAEYQSDDTIISIRTTDFTGKTVKVKCYSEDYIIDTIARIEADVSELYAGQDRTSSVSDYSSDFTWEIGSIYGNNGADYNENTHAIRTPSGSIVYLESATVVGTSNSLAKSVLAFKYNHSTGSFIERIGSLGDTDDLTLPGGYDYRLCWIFASDITITTETISTYSTGTYCYGSNLANLLELVNGSVIGNDYVVGSDFMKTSIDMTELGTLSAIQSFCIYEGNYYSTDGSNLYEQDSSFTLNSTTALSLGHGNAMQLGNNGMAYVSGWNDDSVYVVDLANKTIDSTITLPVTGYTTCAVDDVNGLAYIFHRTTSPGSAEENYNFIVYDYVNSTTVSTKKTTRAFGAMQACDFVDGKIFVLYGLGTNAIPNGYMVLNTSGDIIAEYILGSFSTAEPEGVFVDRDTYDVYISFVTGKLYKVTQ